MDKKFIGKPVLITLTSDFGDDFAKSQLEAVIFSLNPKAKFLVCSNQITPYSIIEGAFTISQFAPLTPKGSMHIAVVDPGVGSNRKSIIIQTTNYFFIGPDNGLLYPAASVDGIKAVYAIDERKISPNHSHTFHGQDIFAKAAALLSLGLVPAKIGKFAPKSLCKLSILPNQVLHIDSYGNIKINHNCLNLSVGDQIKISGKAFEHIIPFAKTFADVKPKALVAYLGSHNCLELAQNLGNANKILKLTVGDILSIAKIKPKWYTYHQSHSNLT